jgi:hypothetical protein
VIIALLAIFQITALILSLPLRPTNNNWDAIGNAGDWTSALATILGFFFLWKQIKREREVLEVQTNAQVYETGIDVLKLFVEKESNLRPYFYDCIPVPEISSLESNDHTWDRVMSACEIMCDQWENIYSSQKVMSREISSIWISYMRGIYLTSPSLRHFLIQEGYRYDSEFIEIFNCHLYAYSTKVRKDIEKLVSNKLVGVVNFTQARHDITECAKENLLNELIRDGCACCQCTIMVNTK